MSVLMVKFKALYNYLRYGSRADEAAGYGTLYGVYLPGVLTMFGVIIYLRLGWVTGSLGLTGTIAAVTLSCLIVFITTLSIASSATNMKVEGGGTYYMISRSLGVEIGSAVGVPLLIAQTMCISFCAMGFAESVSPFFPDIPLNFIGIAALCLMMLLNFSTGLALNTQFLIFLIIVASLASLFTGTPIEKDGSISPFHEGMQIPFWAAFAIFFPAATGVEAGVSMSGELHSPRKALPLGTIAVLATGYIIYICLTFFLWHAAPREYLVNDPLIVQHIAKIPALIPAGIWAATLSSVLGGLLAAPRTLQALSRDQVFPLIFSKEFGRAKEPRIASLLCFIIALIGIYYGSINEIAPVLTMFYLIAYAVLNLAAGLEELLNNPSWRPTFRVPWYVSISGFVLCIMAMFMINSGSTFIAFALVIAIYLYMRRRKIANKWDDIRHGILLFLSRFAIYRLSANDLPLRSWRPNFLVFSGNPTKLSNMLNFTASISKDKGFLTLTSVFPPSLADQVRAERWKKMVTQFLVEKNIESFVEINIDENFFRGARRFLTAYGIGAITPNTVVLGELQKQEVMKEYLQVIRLAKETNKNVLILREKYEHRLQSGYVDIWWDDDYKNNSDLMVLLSHMLLSNKDWKTGKMRLKSIVPEENGRAQRQEHFQKFLEESRLTAEIEVYVGAKNMESFFQLVGTFSADADIVFLGLRPISPDENLEEYGNYYSQVKKLSQKIPYPVFVASSNHLDLKEIFR